MLVAIAREQYEAEQMPPCDSFAWISNLYLRAVSVLVTGQHVVGVHITAFAATIPRLLRKLNHKTGRVGSKSFAIS